MDATLEKLKKILKNSMPDMDIAEVTRESNLLNDLGLDSLNMMLLAIVVEDEFKIRFDTGFQPETVGDLCKFIEDGIKV